MVLVTYHHYDLAGRLVAESDAAGSVQREYIWLHSTPVAIVTSGSDLYSLHSDHLDTPRAVTNQQNQVIWQNPPLSEPFGSGAPDEDHDGDATPFTLNLRFPGQYFDQETNAHYNYYRDHYFPNLGRYGQSDPIGLLGGINTYGYVGGSPISLFDSFGLDVFMCRRPANLPWPLSTFDHYWLKTDTQEAGAGAVGGGVPGQGESDLPLTPMQTNDHSGQSKQPNSECKPVSDVNEQCVNFRIKPGQRLGRFHTGNNCITFVVDVIDECRTVPPPDCAANPVYSEAWKKYRRP
jgi:RHS repeat-associated protein